MKKWKYVRVALALLFFLPITFYFIDFLGLLNNHLHILLHMQVIPAMLMGHWGILIGLFIISLLFGRLYCSTICPLGVFQDILLRIENRLRTKKGKRFRYKKQKSQTILRYTLLVGTLLAFIFGFSAVLLLLDPYSWFGRITSQWIRPFIMWINNVLASIMNAAGNYTVHDIPITTLTFSAMLASGLFLVLLVCTTFLAGRWYCNAICPVGTGLGIISKYSLFKVRIQQDKCNSCGLCASYCKAGCIDPIGKRIDHSRCVSCYNCLGSCKNGYLSYVPAKLKTSVTQEPLPVSMTDSGDQQPTNRRQVLKLTGLALLSASTGYAKKLFEDQDPIQYRKTIMPPGASNRSKFSKKCTACQLCITKCPSHVLKPAGFDQYGVQGFMQPYMNYEHGFCNYNCTICTEVCPTGALQSLSIEKKRISQVGIAQFRQHLCVVEVDQTDCGACSEHCPVQAVTMIPYKNGLTIPHLNPEMCIGCGGCEHICPVRPYRAIYIEGTSVHTEAIPIPSDEVEAVQINDFGF